MSDFKSLNLDSRLLQAIEDLGFTNATPIQMKAIPEALAGHDIRASAQTGTGKTVTYLLPSLHRIVTEEHSKALGPVVLILVPTRELATQVAKEAEKLSRHLSRVKTVCIYGGSPYPAQKKELSRPYEILVATPGRLIDHMEQGRINFSRLKMLILDEADRMLDMGFIDPVEQISSATPSNKQTLMFSATMKGEVLRLSQQLMKNPKEVCVIPENEKYEHIKQEIYYVDHLTHKLEILKHFLSNDSMVGQALIFTSTKQYAQELADELSDLGYASSALHGDMNQRQRASTLQKFRQGRLKLLVATDVAARGIDVPNLSHVFNFDLPRTGEDYTHRTGRTGRAGASGTAISFVSKKEASLIKQIESFIKQPISAAVIAGLEPSFDIQNIRPASRSNNDRRRSSSFRNHYEERSKPASMAPRPKRFFSPEEGRSENRTTYSAPFKKKEFSGEFKKKSYDNAEKGPYEKRSNKGSFASFSKSQYLSPSELKRRG